jgi:hypothetical protein
VLETVKRTLETVQASSMPMGCSEAEGRFRRSDYSFSLGHANWRATAFQPIAAHRHAAMRLRNSPGRQLLRAMVCVLTVVFGGASRAVTQAR